MFESIRIIGNYFDVVKVNKKRVLTLFITALFTQIPYMFTSLLFSLFIKFLVESNIEMMIIITITYFGLKTISKIFGVINAGISKKYFNETYRYLHNTLLAKIGDLNVDFFTNGKKGEVLNTSNTDIKELSNFCNWLIDCVIVIISFFISIIILGSVNVGLMVFGIIINMIVIGILNVHNKKYERIIKKSKEKTDNEIGFFTQIVNGLSEIKIFNIMPRIESEYVKRNEEYLEEHDKIIDNTVMRNYIIPSITMLAEAILMIYYIVKFIDGEMTVDRIILINAYFGNMFSSLNLLITNMAELRVIKASISRYEKIIDEKKLTLAFGTNTRYKKRGEIKFNNVGFAYNNNNAVLNDINFTIPSRQITAISGESGSGKTTLFNLLLRFYQPNSGSITINDIDIFEFDNETYCENVSVVKQHPFIFNMSIYENLALIDPDLSRIIQVCKQVHIHDYIISLPDGYDTIINEDATDLSGGQKQRLSIARTLLKKTEIVLLDEITSALDRDLANNIFELLNELKKDHTFIMITHKREEIDMCDHVIQLI